VHCGDRTDRHEGPYGDNCPHKTKCANCYGLHPASHTNCPAAPRWVHGHLIKPTKTELKAIRRAGKAAYQHLYRTVKETLNQATQQDVALPTQTQQETLPYPLAQRRELEEESRAASARIINVSQASSSTTNREKRLRRAATGCKSLNLAQMSASSMYLQAAAYTDSSISKREDTSMSDNPLSSC
jgi:hypothetical protein